MATDKNKIGIIIAAGGTGKRFGTANKLFLELDGIPVFIRTIKALMDFCPAENMIIPVHASEKKLFTQTMEKYVPDYTPRFIDGGETRTMSVWNALSCFDLNTVEYVAIHDAARPFMTARLFSKCLEAAVRHGGALAAKPVSDTIKKADAANFIETTLDRSKLWTVETPQIFKLKLLIDAYENSAFSDRAFTDDAGIMEASGHKVFLVENLDFNMKITYPSDANIASAFLKCINNSSNII